MINVVLKDILKILEEVLNRYLNSEPFYKIIALTSKLDLNRVSKRLLPFTKKDNCKLYILKR
jgi:hypothetical protein